MTTLPAARASFLAALPYWVSLLTLPLAALAALWGGWWVLLLPALPRTVQCVFRVNAGTDFTGSRAPISRDHGQTWSTY